MSLTKNYRVICDMCGLFCQPFDQETPFGCADPEYPEPYDPYHYCRKCSEKLYQKYLKGFQNGERGGYWEKSNAEVRAAKESGLEWVHSNGYIDTRTNLDVCYRYISIDEKKFYVPYLEFLKDPENRKKHEDAKEARWKELPSLI